MEHITDPLQLAAKEISDTQLLLEQLITSSESFDYPKAKAALKLLRLKKRQLERLRHEFSRLAPDTNICRVDFANRQKNLLTEI